MHKTEPKLLAIVGLLIAGLTAFVALVLGLGTGAEAPLAPPVTLPPAPPPLPPMSQAVDGYTLMMQPLFADANHVVFSATLAISAGSEDNSFHVVVDSARLIDDHGTNFPWFNNYDGDYNGWHIASWSAVSPASFVLAFDLPDGISSRTLKLHLTTQIEVVQVDRRSLPPRPGPFAFDVTMPTDPAYQIVEPNQTIAGAGGTLTLDRVVVTLHETRAFLHFNDPSTRPHFLNPPVVLQIGSWMSQQEKKVFLRWLDQGKGKWLLDIGAPLLEKPGNWVLSVSNDERFMPGRGWYLDPWIFTFALPPIGAPPLVDTPAILTPTPTPTFLPTPLPTVPLPLPPGTMLPRPLPSAPGPVLPGPQRTAVQTPLPDGSPQR